MSWCEVVGTIDNTITEADTSTGMEDSFDFLGEGIVLPPGNSRAPSLGLNDCDLESSAADVHGLGIDSLTSQIGGQWSVSTDGQGDHEMTDVMVDIAPTVDAPMVSRSSTVQDTPVASGSGMVQDTPVASGSGVGPDELMCAQTRVYHLFPIL